MGSILIPSKHATNDSPFPANGQGNSEGTGVQQQAERSFFQKKHRTIAEDDKEILRTEITDQ
jgi:hypothetical protein